MNMYIRTNKDRVLKTYQYIYPWKKVNASAHSSSGFCSK